MKHHEQTPAEKIQQTVQHLGLAVMGAAMSLVLVEFAAEHHHAGSHGHTEKPSYSSHETNQGAQQKMRNRVEEAGAHNSSYGAVMRTPARSGSF